MILDTTFTSSYWVRQIRLTGSSQNRQHSLKVCPDRRIDAGRPIDWGRVANDYARYRAGPPDSFYEQLRAADVGLPNQRFLDLGTGTGALARRFAANGCDVVGMDISLPSLVQAMKAPRTVRYVAAMAEAPP